MEASLRRYTELPYVVQLLHTKRLVLISPQSWDDRNDAYYIEQYARELGFKGIYALCLAEAQETYHHWRVFSHGTGGACIHFDKDLFVSAIMKVEGLRAEDVQYKTIDELKRTAPKTGDLPFLKRYAYQHEQEFRLIYGSKKTRRATYRVPIPLSAITRITLSPWLSKDVGYHVQKTLKSIPGCRNLRITRSTLVENQDWKEFANSGR